MIDETKTPEETGNEVNELLQKKDFGTGLRLAREKLGLSANDVAENLLISVDVIKALENSQADALPALTFTQGYIRSYARMLGLSADQIIDDYVSMAPVSKQVLIPHSVLPAQKSSNDMFMKIITFGFVIVGLIVLIFWLNKTDFRIKSEKPDLISNSSIQDTSKYQTEENIAATSDNSASDDSVVDVPEVSAVTAENIQPEEFQPKQVQTEIIQPVSESELGPDSAAVSGQTSEAEITGDTNTDAVIATDKLVVSALGESWCEIQDSTGKRLFYQLLNRGDEINLTGVAPFTVFLGNAPKIRVEINNKIVDFENLINKSSNIASIEINTDASVFRLSNR